MALRLPPSARNWLSLTGVIIAVSSFFMIIFLFAITAVMRAQAAYLGLVIYILLPAIMIMGLICIPVGMYITSRRGLPEGSKPGWPKVDLEDPHHRHAAFIFLVGTLFFLLISAVGGYEAFHFTESVTFCGTLCHTVMEPEHVAHANSPHARVACVSCHVGPGADWYVRSKLSGLYQVYAVIAHVYPRPIPTPIHNLRPAREVCEQCHWPQQFYAQKHRMQTYYLPDKENTPWVIGLNMKTGSPQAALGLVEGIHWHINPNVRIEYVATDKGRQQIPWVRMTDLKSGKVKIFTDRGTKIDDAKLRQMEVRTMDCIDCHNRPSHRYRPPDQFIDNAITAGIIPQSLPEIKRAALEACAPPDATPASIRQKLSEFYRSKYPEVMASQAPLVEKATAGVVSAFSKNVFPYMKARWSAYPDHIGHLYYPGCFRCHNGTHATDNGEKISRDCEICHDITMQGPAGSIERATIGESLPFRHPEEIGDAWEETFCNECHTGTGGQ